MTADLKTNARAAEHTERVVAQMPLVRELVGNLKAEGFSFDRNVVLFGVQHLMDQTLGFCWALRELGISYDRMALAGKCYSTNLSVVASLSALGVAVPQTRQYALRQSQAEEQIADIGKLAEKFIDRKEKLQRPIALVVDDGGLALANFTRLVAQPADSVAGVEQTASGFWQPGVPTVPFPVIDVGASAVKRICEPQMIISAAMKRARNFIGPNSSGKQIGVAGLGYIGTALVHHLVRGGLSPITYDSRDLSDESDDVVRLSRVRDMYSLLASSDVIFGCTGSDVTGDFDEQVAANGLPRRLRELVSLSSSDHEFFSLKQALLEDSSRLPDEYGLDSIPDVVGSRWGSPFRIVRNGFPINFDNNSQSVPLNLIQGTIVALVAAVCQAFRCVHRNQKRLTIPTPRVMLDVGFQEWLFDRWPEVLPDDSATMVREQSRLLDGGEIARCSQRRTKPPSVRTDPCFGMWARRAGNPN